MEGLSPFQNSTKIAEIVGGILKESHSTFSEIILDLIEVWRVSMKELPLFAESLKEGEWKLSQFHYGVHYKDR
jgi:hypothetical protein